jgi:hypothetical protein
MKVTSYQTSAFLFVCYLTTCMASSRRTSIQYIRRWQLYVHNFIILRIEIYLT